MPDQPANVAAAAAQAEKQLPAPVWPWRLALASPFVLAWLVLLAKGWTWRVFWGHDETDHWALSLWFAERLPHFSAFYPHSATTPLFHLLGACVTRFVAPSLPLMRILNTAFSLAGVLALFGSLRCSQRHGPATAAWLSAVYLTSCYFFGYSFRWLTDNLALTFCILALAQLFRFADPTEPRRLGAFFLGCLWCALASLTRQNYLFLCLPFTLVLLLSELPPPLMIAGLAGLGLAVAPFAGLAAAWHGLVPPLYQGRHLASPINLYPIALPVLLLGFYTPFFYGYPVWRALRSESINPRALVLPAVVAAIALVVVARFPLVPWPGHPEANLYFPAIARGDVPGYFAGWIYNVAGHFPRLHGNSILFWLLLPAGAAAAAWFVRDGFARRDDPSLRVSASFLLGVMLSSTLNIVSAQKYYDALVLLFLIWHTRGEVSRQPWRRAALGGLILMFCAYQAVWPFVAGELHSEDLSPSQATAP